MVGRSTLTYKIHRGETCLGCLDGTDHKDFQNKSICHPPMEMPIWYSGKKTYILRCTCFHVPCMQLTHPSW